MIVKLLTGHHLEFLSLKRGCTTPSESTLVKMQKCRGISLINARLSAVQMKSVVTTENIKLILILRYLSQA